MRGGRSHNKVSYQHYMTSTSRVRKFPRVSDFVPCQEARGNMSDKGVQLVTVLTSLLAPTPGISFLPPVAHHVRNEQSGGFCGNLKDYSRDPLTKGVIRLGYHSPTCLLCWPIPNLRLAYESSCGAILATYSKYHSHTVQRSGVVWLPPR